MGGEGGGSAVPIGSPGPDVPLGNGDRGVFGVVVQAVITVVVDLHGNGVGLAFVVARSGVEGFDGGRFALILIFGAVDPHFGCAVGVHRGATVATVLVPVCGGDDEAELVELAAEGQRSHLAPAVSSGEGMVDCREARAASVCAPHVHAAIIGIAGWLVVHDESGLAVDGFRITHGRGLIGHTHVRDARVGVVVAAALRVLPLVGAGIVKHEVDLLAPGVDGGAIVPLLVEGHVGFRLVPVIAKTVVDLRALPAGIGGLVVDGDASVVGQGLVPFLVHVRIGRVVGHAGCRVAVLGGACIQCDGGMRRYRGLDLAVLDAYSLGAVHGGVHVAVFAVGERCRVGGVLVGLAVVDGDEALIPAGEGDVVAAVILPVGDLGAVDVVAEGDHASGGGPALLAVPVGAVGGTDLVHIHVRNGCGGGSRCAVVVLIPLVVGKQTRRAVVVGKHECVGQLILGTVLVGQGALVARGVPVGDEHVGVFGGEILAQPLIKSLEVCDLVFEGLVHFGLEAEFGHRAVLHVVARLDARGFGGVPDDLLDPVDAVGVHADLLCELLLDGLHAVRVDVLDGIHTEAANTSIPQGGKIVRLNILDLFALGVEVPHGAQAAFLDFLLVGVVGDVLGAAVEVGGRDAFRILFGGKSRVVAGRTVVFGSCDAGLLAVGHVGTGGLVQHNVGDDVNADGIALLDHVFEFGFRAELGIELVAYRLVGRPPLRALDGFLRRRHLDVCHAFRTVCARAFLGDRVPCLLEGDDLHVFLRIRLRLGLSLSHMRYRHQGGARHGGGDAYGHRTASRPIHSLNDHCSPFSSLRSNSGPHGRFRPSTTYAPWSSALPADHLRHTLR